MKRKLTILIIITIAVFSGTGVVLGLNGYFGGGSTKITQDTSTRGLVGYWNFEEVAGQDIVDSSGSGNDGTLGTSTLVATDDPTWSHATGTVARAAGLGGVLDFDGADDLANIPDSSSLDITDEITISFWIKAD